MTVARRSVIVLAMSGVACTAFGASSTSPTTEADGGPLVDVDAGDASAPDDASAADDAAATDDGPYVAPPGCEPVFAGSVVAEIAGWQGIGGVRYGPSGAELTPSTNNVARAIWSPRIDRNDRTLRVHLTYLVEPEDDVMWGRGLALSYVNETNYTPAVGTPDTYGICSLNNLTGTTIAIDTSENVLRALGTASCQEFESFPADLIGRRTLEATFGPGAATGVVEAMNRTFTVKRATGIPKSGRLVISAGTTTARARHVLERLIVELCD